jgi:hypothetical protein
VAEATDKKKQNLLISSSEIVSGIIITVATFCIPGTARLSLYFAKMDGIVTTSSKRTKRVMRLLKLLILKKNPNQKD